MTTKVVKKKAEDAKGKTKSALPAGGYEAMVSQAIVTLAERNGSSPVAILKAISTDHKDIPEDRLKLQVKMALKRMTAKEKLVKVKASYKLASAEKAKKMKELKPKAAPKASRAAPKKKETATKPKKVIAKKPKTSKTGTTKKAATTKTTKRATTKKTAAKKK